MLDGGALDTWLADLQSRATIHARGEVALVAVGSLGRAERCPYSDLDLLLLHSGLSDPRTVAEAIWYPIWDAGFTLDHSVRTLKECVSVAGTDVRAALGLLDARLIAGDGPLYRQLVDRVRRMWETKASTWLPALAEAAAERHATSGEVAFTIEPDIKEGKGGLRDVQVMRAAVLARPGLGPVAPEVDAAAVLLRRVRDALHRRAGRPLDRLLLELQSDVTEDLGYATTADMVGDLAGAARAVAWHGDQLWQEVTRPRRRRGRRSLHHGIELKNGDISIDGEVVNAETVLRAAGYAAQLGVPLRDLPVVEREATPWSEPVRAALCALLGWGHAAIPVMEYLDHAGVLVELVPEWVSVRNRPQRNPYHRYTVDRHLLETAAEAAELKRRVRRPDLLLIGALVHDIGKGVPGRDHTDAGVELVEVIATRMGFPSSDVDVLTQLVRHHLTLADAATRRDIDDPATIGAVAAAVRSADVLDLLEALTEADGKATGPTAWTAWKARLVAALAERVRRRLAGEELRMEPWTPAEPIAPGITIGETVRVVAPDRRGLLAEVAGALAACGLNVRAARVTTIGDLAVEEFDVDPSTGGWPDIDRTHARLEAAVTGTLPLEGLLADRQRSYRSGGPRPDIAPEVLFEAASDTTVIEVRAADSVGLLYRVAAALSDLGLDVVQVHAATIGHEAVDAFYVRGLDPVRQREVTEAVVAAVAAP